MQKVERQNSFIYFVGQIYASCGHFSLLLAKSGTFGQLLPASVHLFALLDFGTGCIAIIVFSFSGCRFAHLALFSWLSNIQVLLRQNGFCQHHHRSHLPLCDLILQSGLRHLRQLFQARKSFLFDLLRVCCHHHWPRLLQSLPCVLKAGGSNSSNIPHKLSKPKPLKIVKCILADSGNIFLHSNEKVLVV